ncbi:MAG: LpxI family protein, partial [Candidatus Aminicenantales bacterium]
KLRSPAVLLKAIIDYLEQEGLEIKSPMFLLSSLVCKEGTLTVTKPSPAVEEDIAFGWKVARQVADLDIGQTVVVKDRAVVAVEGMEGTDKTIKRAGRLAGQGTVVVKVARTQQDARVDLPAVGLKTLEAMAEAGSQALCFEAEIMPFFQKEKAIKLADIHHISIIAKKSK